MAASEAYDAVVIGAGVEGSSTAYHLAKAGRSTLMLEQVRDHLQITFIDRAQKPLFVNRI